LRFLDKLPLGAAKKIIMNNHLNVFKTYSKENRAYQLENDLTRSLAICLQEDALFFHEFLKIIFNQSETDFFNRLFESIDSNNEINIDIQLNANKITNFDYVFAVSLSENEMSDFWSQNFEKDYDPICDLVIKINNIIIVIETKRDNVNCTAQLYNQIFNICKFNFVDKEFTNLNFKEIIYPFDLNWKKLMIIATKVASFEKSTNNHNRFLVDFIELIKSHNHNWLPESSIYSLKPENKILIERRIESAIIDLCKTNNINKLQYNDRIGIDFQLPWAQEILFSINDKGDLVSAIYPGNTKGQGYHLFNSDPKFSDKIEIQSIEYDVEKMYHIKFTSFQKYFTGLWFGDKELKDNLYTSLNFNKFTGRKKRGIHWSEIENLFNMYLNFDWKSKCKWDELIIGSGKNQFDISFGYKIAITIPFEKLKSIDLKRENLKNLVQLLFEINSGFSNKLIKAST